VKSSRDPKAADVVATEDETPADAVPVGDAQAR
jgi:hypothetical protein